jgi:hypothetical protein
MPKSLTYAQVASRKDKAERFVRDVLDDADRADEISDESVQSYADRRNFTIVDNPPGRLTNMANGQSKQDLLDQIADLQDENDALQSQIDAISDILDGGDEDDDGDDGDQG